MADPLSSATRATKRNLLIASVIAISANAFNISIDKIPLAGLSINFDDRLFAFLLVITLVYFLCTFILYYVIDIKNLQATQHQLKTEDTYTETLARFEYVYAERIRRRIEVALGDGYKVPTQNSSFGTLRPSDFENRLYLINRPPLSFSPQQNPDVYEKAATVIDSMITKFNGAKRWHSRRRRLLLLGVRAMYVLRNYFFDGILPIALGVFALVAILGHLDLHWVQRLLPTFKVLSP